MALPDELLYELNKQLSLKEALRISVVCDICLEDRSLDLRSSLINFWDYFNNCILKNVPIKYMLVSSQNNLIESVYVNRTDKIEDIIVPECKPEIKIPNSVIEILYVRKNHYNSIINVYNGCVIDSDLREKYLLKKIVRGRQPNYKYAKEEYSIEYDAIALNWDLPKFIHENIRRIYGEMQIYSDSLYNSGTDILVLKKIRVDLLETLKKYNKITEIILPLDTEFLKQVLEICPELKAVGYTNPDDENLIKSKGIKGFRFIKNQ